MAWRELSKATEQVGIKKEALYLLITFSVLKKKSYFQSLVHSSCSGHFFSLFPLFSFQFSPRGKGKKQSKSFFGSPSIPTKFDVQPRHHVTRYSGSREEKACEYVYRLSLYYLTYIIIRSCLWPVPFCFVSFLFSCPFPLRFQNSLFLFLVNKSLLHPYFMSRGINSKTSVYLNFLQVSVLPI